MQIMQFSEPDYSRSIFVFTHLVIIPTLLMIIYHQQSYIQYCCNLILKIIWKFDFVRIVQPYIKYIKNSSNLTYSIFVQK